MSRHRRRALRTSLALLALAEAVVGVWASLFPRAFYDNFPLPGHDWVAMLPPYSPHLISDVGALNLALAFMLAVAVLTLQPLLVRAVLVGYLFYTVPHLVFHVRHMAGFPSRDAIAETTVLSMTVGLPLLLLVLARKPRQRPPRPAIRSGEHEPPIISRP